MLTCNSYTSKQAVKTKAGHQSRFVLEPSLGTTLVGHLYLTKSTVSDSKVSKKPGYVQIVTRYREILKKDKSMKKTTKTLSSITSGLEIGD